MLTYNHHHNKLGIMTVFMLCLLLYPVSAAKEDYLTIDYQECNLVSCYTQYTMKNPDNVDMLTEAFDIDSLIEQKGSVNKFEIRIWNGTSWDLIKEVNTILDKGQKELETQKTKDYLLTSKTGVAKIRVYGYFAPTYEEGGISYSFDHIPRMETPEKGDVFLYPEYDIWNQSWQKCLEVNITYNLKNYSLVNETFPQRIILNGSIINLSAVKSNYQDIRFGNGTCANVITDLEYNKVYSNTTHAEMIFYTKPAMIINNTPMQIVIMYNNSGATHVEPGPSIGWTSDASVTTTTAQVKVFTNDKTSDNASTSTTALNQSAFNNLTTFGSATLTQTTIWGIMKRLNNATSALFSDVELASIEGYSMAMRVNFLNVTIPAKQYLFHMGNATDTTQTKILEAYITTTPGTSGTDYKRLIDQAITSKEGTTPYSVYTNTTETSAGLNSSQLFDFRRGVGNNFDGDAQWGVATGMNIQLDLGSGNDTVVSSYNLTISLYNGSRNLDPVSMIFEGSADNSSWAHLGWHNTSSWSNGEKPRQFNTSNAVAYRYYRWRVHSGQINSSVILFSEITPLRNPVIATNATSILTYNAYFEDGIYAKNFSVGTLQENVSYDIAILARKTASTGKKAALIFNGVVYADDDLEFSGSGAPFKENSTVCGRSGDDYCLNYTTYGAETIINSNQQIIGAQNSLNGSIDEVFFGVSNTGNTSRFHPAFLLAWGSQPVIAFGSNSTAEVVLPITNLSCSGINKTAILCTWRNPIGASHNFTKVLINGTNIANVSNTTINYTFTGLQPNNTYNLTFLTVTFFNTTYQQRSSRAWYDQAAPIYEFESGDGRDSLNIMNLTLNNTYNSSGLVGSSAVSCNNTPSNLCSMNIPDPAVVHAASGNGSEQMIGFFFKANNSMTAQAFFYDKGSGFQRFYAYLNANGTVTYDFINGSAASPASGTAVVNDNTTHSLIFARNSTHIYNYVDGVLDTIKLHTNSIMVVNSSFFFFRRAATATDYLNGTMDEIFMTNRTLSEAEILSFSLGSAYNTVSPENTSNISSTIGNPPPNITSYYPLNLTPNFEENTTQHFNITVTDDDGSPIISWFKNNILQTIGDFWNWIIGYDEQGVYNITAIANDTYGATDSVTWIVTINDTYPAPTPPVFNPNGGLYRTHIPISCPSPDGSSTTNYYDISVQVNNGAWENISVNNRFGVVDMDITQYNYYTNFTFNCTAVGVAGNRSTISNNFTRDYINEFYSTTTSTNMKLTSVQPYVMSLYYDAQNPTNYIYVRYAYADCNGDGLFDYVYNYSSYNVSRIKNYYTCAFQAGTVPYEIGVFIEKNSNSTWEGSGCSESYDYSNTCLVKKVYTLGVAAQ